MAQKSYKVGESIEVLYQALNAKTAATIHMEVYDEAHALVVGGPVVLLELGASGRYYGAFVPNEVGEWSVQIQEEDGTGKVVKAYSVGTKNIQEIGAGIDAVQDDTTALGVDVGVVDGKIDGVDAKADITHGMVDAIDAKIVNLDGDVVILANQVAGLESPPMVG